MKTFIKWSGNKSRYLKHIIPHIPSSFTTYIEPFIGSGALFLHLQPNKWIINDLNRDLIEAWLAIQNNLSYVKSYITSFGTQFLSLTTNQRKQLCIDLTSNIEHMKYGPSRGILFLLMKYCAYMGNIMIRGKYKFYGLELNLYKSDTPIFLSQKYYLLLDQINKFLNTTDGRIYNTDYKKILQKAKQGDFVFLDPPYFESNDYKFTYTDDPQPNPMQFLHELLNELIKLDKKGVKWLMTQADTKDVRKVFGNYTIKKFKVYRAYAKVYKYELIIKNY